jgi:hypothetical protein
MNPALLDQLARKYVWWSSPAQALAMPERVVAHVMNMGDYDDVQSLVEELGDEYLRRVVVTAEAGQFSERSWGYWHYRLGLCALGDLPPMPQRSLE